jgi:hypothetical protein
MRKAMDLKVKAIGRETLKRERSLNNHSILLKESLLLKTLLAIILVTPLSLMQDLHRLKMRTKALERNLKNF